MAGERVGNASAKTAVGTSRIAILIAAISLVVSILANHEPILRLFGQVPPFQSARQEAALETLMDYLSNGTLQTVDAGVLAPGSDAEAFFKQIRRLRVAYAETLPNEEFGPRQAKKHQDRWEVCDEDNECSTWSNFHFDEQGRILTAKMDNWWFGELLMTAGATGSSKDVHVTPTGGLRYPPTGSRYSMVVSNQSSESIQVSGCLLSDPGSGGSPRWEFTPVAMESWTQRSIYCPITSNAIGSPQHVGVEFIRGEATEAEIVWVTFNPASEE